MVYDAAVTDLQTDVDRVACQPTQHRHSKHSDSRRDYLEHHARRRKPEIHLKRVAMRMSSCSRCTYTRTISVEWGEFDDVFRYLLDREYPAGLSKVARALRQKAQSFAVDDGVLFHRNGENLCRVVVELNERDRIVQSLYADPVGGGHYGQTATIRKVTDRFWWCNVTSDTREYVRTCAVCQKANPLNRPPPASLHPCLFHRWSIDLVVPLHFMRSLRHRIYY